MEAEDVAKTIPDIIARLDAEILIAKTAATPKKAPGLSSH